MWWMWIGCYSAALPDVVNGRAFLYNASERTLQLEVENLDGAACARPIEFSDLPMAVPLPPESVELEPGESYGLWRVHENQGCIAANVRVEGVEHQVLFRPNDPRTVTRVRGLALFGEPTLYIAPDEAQIFSGPRYPDPPVCQEAPARPTFEASPGAGLVTHRTEEEGCVTWTLEDGSGGEVCGDELPLVPLDVGEPVVVSVESTSVQIETDTMTFRMGLTPEDVPDWLQTRRPREVFGDACLLACDGGVRMRMGFPIESSEQTLKPVQAPGFGELVFFVSPLHEPLDLVVYDATFGDGTCEETLMFAALRR